MDEDSHSLSIILSPIFFPSPPRLLAEDTGNLCVFEDEGGGTRISSPPLCQGHSVAFLNVIRESVTFAVLWQ